MESEPIEPPSSVLNSESVYPSGFGGRLGIAADGRNFGTVNTWSEILGYQSDRGVRSYIQGYGVQADWFVPYRGDDVPVYTEDSLAGLIARRIDDETLDLSSATAEPILREAQRIIPSERVRPLVPSTTYRNGLFQHPQSGDRYAQAGFWAQHYHYSPSSSGLLKQRLYGIDAIPIQVPDQQRTKEYPLFSAHAAAAAMESRRNERRPLSVLFPDLESGSVLGSVPVWANGLGTSETWLRDRIAGAAPRRSVHNGQRLVPIYSDEDLLALPNCAHLFRCPVLQSRQQRSLIHPATGEDYVAVDQTTDRRRYREANVTTLFALNTQGQTVEFFSAHDIARVRGEDYQPIPLFSAEYFAGAGRFHEYGALEETLRPLRALALQGKRAGTIALDARGWLREGGRSYLPGSMVIQRLLAKSVTDDWSVLANRVAQARPNIYRNVIWPRHWRNPVMMGLFWVQDPAERPPTSPPMQDERRLREVRQRLNDIDELTTSPNDVFSEGINDPLRSSWSIEPHRFRKR